MASPGSPDPTPTGPAPLGEPTAPRPVGPDEPSAPVDVPPELPHPGIGPDVPPGDPSGPDIRV